MEKPISKKIMQTAFVELDRLLTSTLELVLGGGGCMILAHGYELATTDVDALPLNRSADEINDIIQEVARRLGLPLDWMNPYFSSFTYTLPADYRTRLINVFKGKHLIINALGKEDMLIMKCFAHRPKDIGHARALIKAGADLKFVERVIEGHLEKKLPEAQKAIDFFEDLIEEL